MNIAVINQCGGRYLFEVPDGISLKEGETVKCDTVRGITNGIVWADSLTADEPTAQLIGKLTGAKFPLKSVVGKMEYSEFAKPAPDKPALKVGDRVTASDNSRYYINEVGTIEFVDPSDSLQKYYVKFDKGYVLWCYTDSVKPYIEDKPKYKSGDKVRIIADTCCHEFQMGEILTLAKRVTRNSRPAWEVAESDDWYVREADIEPYIEDEPKFKVGDKVKLRDWKSHLSWTNDIKDGPLTIQEIYDDGSCIVFENLYLYQLEWLEPYTEPEQKPLIVTLEMLRKLGACSSGQAAFVTYFPDEKGEFDAVIRKCYEIDRVEDARWLECRKRQIAEMQDEAETKHEPEYYNGKVVCVESSDYSFTVGKVYNWTDGVVKDNDGTTRPCDGNEKITSLNNSYMKNWPYKFIEYKGEAE